MDIVPDFSDLANGGERRPNRKPPDRLPAVFYALARVRTQDYNTREMTPKYSRKFISRIGDILVSDESTPEERENAIQTLGEWRTLHLQPLNTFQTTLRKYVRSIDSQGIVAQRLKRTPTIIDKLHRYKDMELGRMHDIGGLRAIVKSIQAVRELEEKYRRAKSKHVLKRKYDCIAEPKESGYRGIHLVYENQSPQNPDIDGLLIEIQLRSQLQHLWATAVETVGFFYQEALKSSQGNAVYPNFFLNVTDFMKKVKSMITNR